MFTVVVFSFGLAISILSGITSLWSLTVTLCARKLRKPLWIFRASLCFKDLLLTTYLAATGLYKLAHSLGEFSDIPVKMVTRFDYINEAAFLLCVSSSVFTLLCISIDRYYTIFRTFRYHIGDMMPSAVSLVLVFYCWMFGTVLGISIASDIEDFPRYYGVLLSFLSIKFFQKWLFFGGVSFVYLLSAVIFVLSLQQVKSKRRHLRMTLGGHSEQIHSIMNKRNAWSQRFEATRCSNSEVKPSSIPFLSSGIPKEQNKKNRKWSLKASQDIAPFSPIFYRPSILRRIRDTWYLYAAVETCIAMFFLSLLPTYYLLSTDGYCEWKESFVETNQTVNFTTFSGESDMFRADVSKHVTTDFHCIISVVCECCLLAQGFVNVLIYVYTDDVFRPIFLRPFTCLISVKR